MKQWNLNAMSGATMLKCRSKIVGLKMPLESVGHGDICCVPLGSETRIYEFPSRKYRSIEVGSRISKWETWEFCENPDFRLGNTSFRAQWNAAIHTYRQTDRETQRQTYRQTHVQTVSCDLTWLACDILMNKWLYIDYIFMYFHSSTDWLLGTISKQQLQSFLSTGSSAIRSADLVL